MSDERRSRIPELTVVSDGKYRIGARLGRGGMGQVYQATNTVTGKPVALKWLVPDRAEDEEAARRLVREARFAARVRHPNVVDIYDVGEDGDAVFLVMELLEGEPFDDWIAAHAPAEPTALVTLFVPVLHGLAALHAAGIVHRDLKPANVFIVRREHDPRPIPKLLDFGIARDRLTRSTTITRPGQILGTPAYMAPEQLDAPDEIDPRSDVYACGVILYEALAGERPFVADSLKGLVAKILKGQPTPLHERRPDVPRELSDVVMRAMSAEPADRHRDPRALAEALEAWAGIAPPVPPPRATRTPVLVAGFLAGAVVVGAIASMDFGGEVITPLPPTESAAVAVDASAAAPDAGAPAVPEIAPDAGAALAPTEPDPPAAVVEPTTPPPARRGRRAPPEAPSPEPPGPPPARPEPPGLPLDRDDF